MLQATLDKLGVNPNSGIGALEKALADLPAGERAAIEADIAELLETGYVYWMDNAAHLPGELIDLLTLHLAA